MTRSDEGRTHPGRIVLFIFLVFLAAFSASARNPITLRVSTDDQTYARGETILVSVWATYGDGSPILATRRTQIEIKDGDGRRVIREGLANAGDGYFTYSHTIGSDGADGSWQIKVKIEDLDHDKHVKDKKYDCSWCHGFSRPERGLTMP
jgi:uncharacterized protein YfaS (alpha-2-macroglobulin family)